MAPENLRGKQSAENLVLQPFDLLEKRIFKKNGILFYTFSPQTIRSQKDAGKPFSYVVSPDPQFELVPSMVGQVAFFPDPERFYLKGSNYKTLDQKDELMGKYEKEVLEKLSLPNHIRVVRGQVPDLSQLAFTHLKETGEYLFGEKYGSNCAATSTPTSDSQLALVGHFDPDRGGLLVGQWNPGVGVNGVVFDVPLLVSVAS